MIHPSPSAWQPSEPSRKTSCFSRYLVRGLSTLSALLVCALLAGDASAQDGEAKKELKVDAAYRLRSLEINPLDLSGERVTRTRWTEQRLRLDFSYDVAKVGRVVVQMDALDGVVAGDNGQYGEDPSPNNGVGLAARWPNTTRYQVGLLPGGDPLNPDDYGPVLVQADVLEFNYAYGEVRLPFGLFRFGRQPASEGGNLSVHDGGRHNRWGVSNFSDAADRILFATKLSEAYYVATQGPGYVPDVSLDNGIFIATWWDWLNQGSAISTSDNLRQQGVALQFKRKRADWFGAEWRNLKFNTYFVYMYEERFASEIYAFPLQIGGEVGDFRLSFQSTLIRGKTREISEGFAVLTSREPQSQNMVAQGFQLQTDYKTGPATWTLELDYASGDPDPRPETDITSFSFSRDFNVGLLLFEHVLAFETARSVGLGNENLASLGAPSFPLSEVQSDSRFTNAMAIFPQVKVDWVDNFKHKFHTRFGVLFAWPDNGGVVDPIVTALNLDGTEVKDDAVNFHGGKPGSYYGTEFDVQLQWEYRKFFTWTVEAAYLQPGSSLEDEHGQAADAYLLENRFGVAF